MFVTLNTKWLRSEARALSVSCLSLQRPFTPSVVRPNRRGRQAIVRDRQNWITSCIQCNRKLVGEFRGQYLPTISFSFFFSLNVFISFSACKLMDHLFCLFRLHLTHFFPGSLLIFDDDHFHFRRDLLQVKVCFVKNAGLQSH